MNKKNLIILLGPTAVGKTAVAMYLAREFNTEILSADSRQFFREMNIGTAKPGKEELTSIKHHFINSLSILQDYNVGIFERDALKVLDSIFQKKDIAIMAGGSGLYIQAICKGFDEVPQADKKIRTSLEEMYKHEGLVSLQRMLQTLDEAHYRKVDIKNPHRLIRAIEVCMITGKKYSELRKKENNSTPPITVPRSFSTIKIGLDMNREKLYEKINIRVDEMMAAGLLEEVKALVPFRIGGKLNSLQTVGYKELFEHLEGKYDLKRAVELIKQNTRNFAKRQMTWFRKDNEIKWFDLSNHHTSLHPSEMDCFTTIKTYVHSCLPSSENNTI